MQKNSKDMLYAPLLAQFEMIDNAMPRARFAAIEAVLYLLILCEPGADPQRLICCLPNIS